MRELDIVLSRFLDEDYSTLTAGDQAAFASLLDTADPDLYAWVLGQQPASSPEFRELVTRLQRHIAR